MSENGTPDRAVAPKPTKGRWPKQVPELTPKQSEISDDWMKYFHEIYPERFGAIGRFNQTYPLRTAGSGRRVLEVGAGLGEHLRFEDVANQEYVALELRPEMADEIKRSCPQVRTVVGDVQTRLPFEDDYFDRVLAIQVLEHLVDLPAALDEIRRILRPGGLVAVVIPCEGGAAYTLGRRLTSQRIFEKRYGTSYLWCIRGEHVNVPSEITSELAKRFELQHRSFFPMKVPSIHVNLCIGLTYRLLEEGGREG